MIQIKSSATILNELCDYFDEIIKPQKILRSNTSIIYLLLKALSKGYEVINNLVVSIQNKFDPRYCSEDDLVSTAVLVGEERKGATRTGLEIVATYPELMPSKKLPLGTYKYTYEGIDYLFTINQPQTFIEGEVYSFFAVADVEGKHLVPAQNNIDVVQVTGEEDIDRIMDVLKWSCYDNEFLQGQDEESLSSFRERLISRTDRQDCFTELEQDLRALPYILSATCYYNNSTYPMDIAGVKIDPYHLLIAYSGDARNDVAAVIAKKVLCETQRVFDEAGTEITKKVVLNPNDTNGLKTFANPIEFYLLPLQKVEYTLQIVINGDTNIINENEVIQTIQNAFYSKYRVMVHTDTLTEFNFYQTAIDLQIKAVTILGCDIINNKDNKVDYLNFTQFQYGYLTRLSVENIANLGG